MIVKSPTTPDLQPSMERSHELLIAACRAIARSGARKLSMRDVAEEAGVSKALLHYYFSSRNELLARAYEFSDARGRERVLREVADVESGAVRLSRLLDLYFGDDPQMSEDWNLWSELSSTAIYESELRPVMEKSFAAWSNLIKTLVLDAIDEGSIPADADPVETALRVVALTEGLGSLLTRGLIERRTARNVLEHHLNAEFSRAHQDARAGNGQELPPATGYLRLLAELIHTAVDALGGLATTSEEAEAIRTVSSLIDSRAVTGGSGGTDRTPPGTRSRPDRLPPSARDSTRPSST
jgi:AcrR family transcriptional regulator